MKIERVVPDEVGVPKRLRSLDPNKIKQLAESIDALGLQQPITVWSEADDHLELVAGAHRLAAVISLGWEWIDCIFADGMTDIDRQLWEIDENLMRAELSPGEMAQHLARREVLWEDRKTQVGKVCPPEKPVGNKSPPKQKKGFATDTAKKTGVSKRAINLATARAKAIPEDVFAMIKGTKLDTGTYLDWLKGMEPDDQREQVKTDLAEGVKPKTPKPAPAVDWFEALKRDWGMASLDERQRFDEWRQDK